jgi:hypothetical protein
MLFFWLLVATCAAADWVRAGSNGHQPVWGLRGGLQFAIHPGGFTWGEGGPRGLIRIGYPALPKGEYDLINFIAIEPVVGKTRGLSELEKSSVDGKQGKLFRAGVLNSDKSTLPDPGSIVDLPCEVEELAVPLSIEKFANGAHVRLLLSQRSDKPDELKLTIQAEPDSAPMASCILTATMGNKARTRLLWLKDGSISSLRIFGDYRDSHFTRHAFFPLDRLPRGPEGDVIVAISTDEDNPADSNAGLSRGWQYRGEKVTQYWRKPAEDLHNSLRCAVNARFKYWMSQTPIPGGLAYENFELIESFRDGQAFIFGVTRRSPVDLLK